MKLENEIQLSNGNKMPAIGFGTFDVVGKECERVILDAIDVGYRHIDTASVYGNESQIGSAILKSGVERSSIFLTTKFWGESYDEKTLRHDFQKSLDYLKTEYLDLYLIHFPEPNYLEVWDQMEKLYESGLVKNIGVSNFGIKELNAVFELGKVKPVINQIRLDPLFKQNDLKFFQESFGVCTESWGPLGQGGYNPLFIPKMKSMVEKYQKTPYQIVLRWHIQNKNSAIPKTKNRQRMLENINIFDFEIDEHDMSYISSIF